MPRNFASRAFKLEIQTDIPRLKGVQLLDLHKKDDPKPKRTLPRLEEVELTLHIMLAELAELRAAEAEPPKSKPEPVEALRMARIDGMRAELAAALLDGAPCPVCGSLDHPELCEFQGERVTREQEEAADAEAAVASERAEMDRGEDPWSEENGYSDEPPF